ncbi:MAG: phosphoribosylanthranilate isomerase [Thermodesulfobacteriota bacterium]|nr:phosphoribosylanthranilate isomerase [Thermodesulfobacteriota bacterium]
MFSPVPRIKVCGMTSQTDALYAASLGVDAVGFVLAKSPRRVDPQVVREISLSLPPFVSTVGVVVDMDLETLRKTASLCRLHWIQLHGHESPEYCRALDFNIIKALRVKDRESLEAMAAYEGCVHGFLLDTYVKGKPGGTGRTFDWTLVKEAKKYGPVILAGGLTAEGIREAIHVARPYGVDVSSGVESAPGVKDREKMRRFVAEVRSTMGEME